MSEFIRLADMARELGVNYRCLYWCCKRGRRGRSGQTVKLESWHTVKGLCTTKAAVEAFHEALNKEDGESN